MSSEHEERGHPIVLIVDDEPINTKVLAARLRPEYQVKIADNGSTALEIAASSPHPELILLDIMMPGMDGFEVCRRLKQNPVTASIPVIFVTAMRDQESEQRGLQLGAVDFMTKPVNPSIAFARIRNHLALQRIKRRMEQFFQLSPALFCITDLQGRFVQMNPTWEKVFGFPVSQLLGQRFLDRVHPDDIERTRAAMELLGGGEAIYGFINRYQAQDGSWRWLDWYARLADDVIYAAALDVTDRRHSEEAVRLQAKVFSSAEEGIVITDPEQHIIQVNEAFLRITGYAREEVMGRTPAMLQSGRQGKEFYLDMWQAISTTGSWSGEIWNRRKSGEPYPEHLTVTRILNDDGSVQNYLGVFTDISERKRYEAKLEHIAHFDPLTGIPNRVLLIDRMNQSLAHSKRNNRILAVCYLDLDGFKPVNDRFGHEAGDKVLIEIASRLKDSIRGGDTVARLGGDEFVLLLDIEKKEEAIATLERLLEAIAKPIEIEGQSVVLGASIGVACYPKDDVDGDALLRHADQAMYVAKQSGKNRYHLFDSENDQKEREYHNALRRIEHGLAKGEFVLFYQPKVDMRDGKLTGAEALIRWQHPERGLLLPADFLHVVESSEIEIELGDWVIVEALRQLEVFHLQGLDIQVSINISAHHLLSGGFVEKLKARLAAYPNIPKGSLQIEVLETAALDDMTVVHQIIERCKEIGVGFALDDFGTGYSSLTYLSNLPVDELKIDQSFVREMLENKGDRAIVQGVIALAQTFERGTVAEGVETEQMYQALQEMGCRSGQGYSIARPMPASELLPWAKQRLG